MSLAQCSPGWAGRGHPGNRGSVRRGELWGARQLTATPTPGLQQRGPGVRRPFSVSPYSCDDTGRRVLSVAQWDWGCLAVCPSEESVVMAVTSSVVARTL